MDEPLTPEHDKFRPHQEDANIIGDFIEWLKEQGVNFMKWGEEYWEEKCPKSFPIFEDKKCINGQLFTWHSWWDEDRLGEPLGKCPRCNDEGYIRRTRDEWIRDSRTTREFIAEYFGIDKKKFDEETEAVYQYVSALANNKSPA